MRQPPVGQSARPRCTLGYVNNVVTEDDQEGVATEALPAPGTRLAFGDGTHDSTAFVVKIKLPATAAAVFQLR